MELVVLELLDDVEVDVELLVVVLKVDDVDEVVESVLEVVESVDDVESVELVVEEVVEVVVVVVDVVVLVVVVVVEDVVVVVAAVEYGTAIVQATHCSETEVHVPGSSDCVSRNLSETAVVAPPLSSFFAGTVTKLV